MGFSEEHRAAARKGTIRSYKDLIVWQRAMELAGDAYAVARLLPRSEDHGIAAQMRRAAVSVPANIAEGRERTGMREFRHHLSMASGSVAELETLLLLTRQFGYTDTAALTPALTHCQDVSRLLAALYRSLAPKPLTPDASPLTPP